MYLSPPRAICYMTQSLLRNGYRQTSVRIWEHKQLEYWQSCRYQTLERRWTVERTVTMYGLSLIAHFGKKRNVYSTVSQLEFRWRSNYMKFLWELYQPYPPIISSYPSHDLPSIFTIVAFPRRLNLFWENPAGLPPYTKKLDRNRDVWSESPERLQIFASQLTISRGETVYWANDFLSRVFGIRGLRLCYI